MSAGEVRVNLVVDTSKYVAAMKAAAESAARMTRTIRRIAVVTELYGLNADQVWARMYVRGGLDPAYATPDKVDDYLRILNGIRGDVGEAARTGFLQGWAEHRSVPAAPVVWHRYIGDTAIQVHPEVDQ